MNKVNRFIGIVVTTAALMTNGCTNTTAKRLPPISGITNNNVRLFINNDDNSIIIAGNVSSLIDRTAIERYVREEYGNVKIQNHILFR